MHWDFNHQLTNRVPLIISAPHKPQSHGKVTTVLAESVDWFFTLSELAGLPTRIQAPADDLPRLPLANESTSLVPAFDAFDMTTEAEAKAKAPPPGWKEFAFSQYPRCDKLGTSDSCNNAKKR